jgi:hypothetical protein
VVRAHSRFALAADWTRSGRVTAGAATEQKRLRVAASFKSIRAKAMAIALILHLRDINDS